jgi:TonB family protein
MQRDLCTIVIAMFLMTSAAAAQRKDDVCPPTPPDRPSQTYFACQVDRPATWRQEDLRPLFPTSMARAQVSGVVRVDFVINQRGAVDTASITVLSATHDDFVTQVRIALQRLQAAPAQRKSKVVRQLVTHQFEFKFIAHNVHCREASDEFVTVICAS